MPDVKQLLKDEFSRLARKEFKKSTEPLMKQVSALKIALAEQKKKIALLEKEIQAKNIHPLAQIVQEPLPALKPKGASTIRVGSVQIRKLRKKLNISQAQMAALLDVNVNSVAFWEQGKVVPRPDAKARIAALRSMPKRVMKQILAEKFPEQAEKKKKVRRLRKEVTSAAVPSASASVLPEAAAAPAQSSAAASETAE